MNVSLKEKIATKNITIDNEQQIISLFCGKKIDYSWSFSDKTRKDTAYISHGYHRYPAKFIPQIVSRLVEKYSEKGDLVFDPFVGSGTSLIVASNLNRKAVEVEIDANYCELAKKRILVETENLSSNEIIKLNRRNKNE